MKKLLLSVLTLTLTLSLAACGGNDNVDDAAPTEAPTATEAPAATEAPTEAPAATEAPAGGEATDETVGNTLFGAFNDYVSANADADALTIAGEMAAQECVSLIGPVTMEVEPGFLNGFGNYEVTGFDQGVMFAPMIGSIPFMGYIFSLPADADVDAFVTGLRDNGDLSWNICTSADEMVVGSNGNKVFFVMCPTVIAE